MTFYGEQYLQSTLMIDCCKRALAPVEPYTTIILPFFNPRVQMLCRDCRARNLFPPSSNWPLHSGKHEYYGLDNGVHSQFINKNPNIFP